MMYLILRVQSYDHHYYKFNKYNNPDKKIQQCSRANPAITIATPIATLITIPKAIVIAIVRLIKSRQDWR